MRHGNTVNHLGRTSPHRKAMLANMASSLILHKRIETTVAKAKELKKYVEPLITRSKDDSTHSRRIVFSYLKDKTAVSELYREIALKVAGRPGGYTRILRLGNRMGDNADMCMIELVDYNENMLAATTKKSDAKAKPTRRRRPATKKKDAGTVSDVKEVNEVKETNPENEVAETPKVKKPRAKKVSDPSDSPKPKAPKKKKDETPE